MRGGGGVVKSLIVKSPQGSPLGENENRIGLRDEVSSAQLNEDWSKGLASERVFRVGAPSSQ